jgi:hypothetical protein
MSTIPARKLVDVPPGVLPAGGSAIVTNGLMLSNAIRVPIGTVQEFDTPDAVSQYFGATSIEASMATTYFAGYDGSTVKPGALQVAQYNEEDVAAFLRGGNIAASTTLTELQSFSGTLNVTIDGTLKTANVNLSGSTSFTNAAELIANQLGIEGVQVAAFTCSIATTTLTVTAFTEGEGKLGVGVVLNGASVTAGTFIQQQLTSTETDGSMGGKGTYSVNASQTVNSEAMTGDAPAVQFDSVSGAFLFFSGTAGEDSTISFGSGALATDLLLTQALGAVVSPGAVAATPSPFMDALVRNQRNWVTFFTTFNPDAPDEITVRLAFAQWVSRQSNRFVYVVADSDVSPTVSDPAPNCLGQQIKALGYACCSVNWQPSETNLAAFVSGAAASINFDQPGGRITFDGRSQAGLTPGVTDEVVADNLSENGYNFYGAYGTANAEFIFYVDGSVSGAFTWLDSLINAIWLTNGFQSDLMTLRQNTNAIPYTSAGNTTIEEALSDRIQQGLTFGMYSAGVAVSGSQAAAVNAAAGGLNVAATLSVQGWYLFIGTATPQVRQQRGSPPMKFFYTDGEAVQTISLPTVALL